MELKRYYKHILVMFSIMLVLFYLTRTNGDSRGLKMDIIMSDIGGSDMGRHTSVTYGSVPVSLSNVNLLRVNITMINIPTSVTTYSNIQIVSANPAQLGQVCVGKSIALLPPNTQKSIVCDMSKSKLDELIGMGVKQWTVTITAYNDGLYRTEDPFTSSALPVEVLA